ncbi:fungal-specific transcription factor domain-containing protein [Dactylonectria estremocensis]|uniref:Fungal-specific transcription factor domain-containing protein n=1 Tax=Dactylonectria estremocensis TaxID=1079267 RepID=A0A9P9J1M5_9HYPO|nr:fungal-specific transcription factor domain-containing protein [Dactylonectria estremocensis]
MSSRNSTRRRQDNEQPLLLNSESQSPKPARKIAPAKRSRTGCLTCRARKTKCDESQPACQNCKRCMVECKWPVVEDLLATRARRRTAPVAAPDCVDGDKPAGVSGLPRGGRNAACNGCRGAKCRCSQERPLCARCRELGLVCKYRPVDQPTQDASVSESSTDRPKTLDSDADNIDHVPKRLVQQHIQAFFSRIYPCQANGFIHRSTLLGNFQSGRVDRKLLLAICAAASRFVGKPAELVSGTVQAQAWAKEAKTLLILEDMTTDTVAAALVLARHEVNCGNFASAWMLSSIATRAALALGLNNQGRADDESMAFSEQETRRRLFWACYCLDRMMSTGLSELTVIRAEHLRLQLPCEEYQYTFGISCWTLIINLEEEMPAMDQPSLEQLQAQGDVGMFGQYVQVMQMRYSILKYVRNHPEDLKELPPWDTASTFAQCVHKMTTWRRCLPPQFQLLPDTIYMRQSQDQLSPLIMLHVWYEQCMSDLYRIVMPGFPETLLPSMLLQAPEGWVQQHQVACVRHASNIASIFETVSALIDMEGFLFLDTSLPMCVFDSTRVRVQWLFMPPSESPEERIEECKASFETLIGYVERMAEYFQQAKWLLKETRKMLSRHGIPIHGTIEPCNSSDSSGVDAGSHPWQKRIQHLKDDTKSGHWSTQQVNQAPQETRTTARPMVVPTNADQDTTQRNVNLSNTLVHDGSLYALPQGMNFDFPDHRDLLYQDGLAIPLHGWGEAQVIPGLANFMGMSGEWLADSVNNVPNSEL